MDYYAELKPFVNEMFKSFIEYLFQPDFHGKFGYAHNLSTFDGVILLNHLYTIKGLKVDLLYLNNKIYKISLKRANETIIFKDSYLLAPASLDKLGTSLGVPTPKGKFNHDWVTPLKLDYVGKSPNTQEAVKD